MLAILGATSYSFYSDCRILSNRNAILSIKVTIFLSILILSTHLRSILFILSFYILQQPKKYFDRQNQIYKFNQNRSLFVFCWALILSSLV